MTRLILTLSFFAVSAFAGAPPVHAPAKILGVGAIAIEPCQDPRTIAEWYSKLGIETQEIEGGYYGKLDTAAGAFVFGIHPKKPDAPRKCAGTVSVIYKVADLDASVAAAKAKGLEPESSGQYPEGKFAFFHDPDNNSVSLWQE